MADQISKIIFTAEDKTQAVFDQVKKGLAAVGVAVSAQQFAEMIQGATDSIASYKQLGDVAGTTAEQISMFDLPARQAGISLDSVAQSVARLGKSIGEARLGDQSKITLFKALGIDPNDGRDAALVMVDVVKVIANMTDQTLASKAASDLLGKSFVETRAFAKQLADQGALTALITNQQAEAAQHYKDNTAQLELAVQQLKIGFVNDLLPSMNAVTDAMVRAQREGGMLSAVIAGIQTALTGNDRYKNDKAIVELTNEKLVLENQILAVQNQSAAFRGISADKLKAKLADVDAQLRTALIYARDLDNTGTAAARPDGMDEVAINAIIAEAHLKQRAEFEKHYAERVAAEQAFQQRYAAAIQAGNALDQEAFKQGLLTQDELIRQTAAREDALLQVKQISLQRQAQLDREKGDPAALARARAAAETAATIAAQRQANEAITAARITSLRASQAQEFAQWQAGEEQKGAAVADSLRTDRQIEDRAYQQRLASLEVYLAANRDQIGNADKLREQLEKQHQANLTAANSWGIKSQFDIDKMGLDQKLDYYTGTLANITAAGAQHNKTLFEINKAASIANAIVSTYEGAAAAYKWGWPLGPIFAAVIVAAGLANVRAIAATKFGDTSASPVYSANPSTGAPTGPVAPAPIQQSAPAGSQVIVNVTVQGNVIGGGGMQQIVQREVVPALQDLINNSDVVIIGANSRQAANLASV